MHAHAHVLTCLCRRVNSTTGAACGLCCTLKGCCCRSRIGPPWPQAGARLVKASAPIPIVPLGSTPHSDTPSEIFAADRARHAA